MCPSQVSLKLTSFLQVLYNPELKHLITVCTESSLKVWETDTGKLVYQITEVHGSNIEVTAIALDKSGYRLATGAHDGKSITENRCPRW